MPNPRKTGKEQYYTPESLASTLVDIVLQLVPDAQTRPWIDPAAGTGSFIRAIRSTSPQANIWAVDIEPKAAGIGTNDFLLVDPPVSGAICLTNPPFGRNHSLSIPFFNHAAEFCDYIAFIVPRSWRKWSIINRLDSRMHLLYDMDLGATYEDAAGRPITDDQLLRTVFQVWERRADHRERITVPDRGYIKVVKPDVADASLTIFGRGCGTLRTEFARKKNTTQMYLAAPPEVIDALRRIDLSRFYNNVAYVEALALPEINFCLNEYFDRE